MKQHPCNTQRRVLRTALFAAIVAVLLFSANALAIERREVDAIRRALEAAVKKNSNLRIKRKFVENSWQQQN